MSKSSKNSQIINFITNWLGDYLKKSSQKGFVVGISGGIDSALSSALAARSGAKVLALSLPIDQKVEEIQRAREQIDFLEKKFPSQIISLELDLSLLADSFSSQILEKVLNTKENFKNALDLSPSNKNLSLANSKSRLRMATLYYYASLFHFLVLGTGNKIEDFGVGFFTKYGDGAVDLSPIADLTKSQVRALSKELQIPSSIQRAAPTDGLWGKQETLKTDEEQLGASYEALEWAMRETEKGKTSNDFEGKEKELIQKYLLLHQKNLHKINPIPVCKIPENLK